MSSASTQVPASNHRAAFIAGGNFVLDCLGDEVVDPTQARHCLSAVTPLETDQLRERWWSWIQDAAVQRGLHVRVIECTVAQARELARFHARLITCTVSAVPRWFIIEGVSGKKLLVREAQEHDALARMTVSELEGKLQIDETGVTRWLVAEPQMASHSGHHAEEMTPLARLHALMRPEWSDVWIVLVFGLVVGLLALATPIAVEALVNTVAFGVFLQPVVVLSLMLLVFLLFAAALRAVQTYVVEIIQRRLFARVAGDLAWRLPRVRHEAFDREYGPELINRFFDVVTVQKTTALLLLDGVALVIGALVGMAVLAFYHPWLLGFDLLLLAMMAFTVLVLGRGAVKSSIKESKAKYYVAGWLEELARCRLVFKAAGSSDFATGRADRLIGEYLLARKAHFRVLFRQIAFALVLQALASTVLLGIGGWLVIQGQLTLGQLVAAEMIVAVVVGAFAKMGKYFEGFYDLLASVDKLGILFDLPVETQHGISQGNSGLAASVKADRLTYSFPDGEAVIQELSFVVPPGETFGIQGPSGSGKTTLLELLYGLRQPSAGHIELDDIDLRDLRRDALRRDVVLVGPIEVLHGTIADNLHLHRQGIRTADLRNALQAVGLLEQVLALPNGMETVLEENGAPLSGNAMRKLMLARGIVAAPHLLLIDGLLDELPDGDAESILERLQRLPQCTVVIASGRASLLRRCSRVISLDPQFANCVTAPSASLATSEVLS